jgi:hypothetical protein
MRSHQSIEHSHFSARNVRQMAQYAPQSMRDVEALRAIGIGMDEEFVEEMMSSKFLRKMAKHAYSMDAIQPTITTPSIQVPIQFLQNWLPGFVFIMTAPREADEFMGITTSGSWEDAQVVQGVLERVGTAVVYGDQTNVPYSSWNTNFLTRTVVRFEEGMSVGRLETAEAARMRVDNAGTKRRAAALSLEIIRNFVGFYGFNMGNNNTYGFLNEPSLPSYVEVTTGVAGFTWSVKTFLEICKDIRTAIVALRTNSSGLINPEKVKLTLAVATDAVDWLSTTSDFGISVSEWMKKAYPNIRVVNAPQLNNANAGDNVFYLYAEEVTDDSTDDSRTWVQVVPAKFQVLGVEQLAKSYKEDYSNATSGAFLKRPYAVVRYFNI